MLRAAIVQIQNHTQSKLSYEELYRSCYNLVLHRHGAKLCVLRTSTCGGHPLVTLTPPLPLPPTHTQLLPLLARPACRSQLLALQVRRAC